MEKTLPYSLIQIPALVYSLAIVILLTIFSFGLDLLIPKIISNSSESSIPSEPQNISTAIPTLTPVVSQIIPIKDPDRLLPQKADLNCDDMFETFTFHYDLAASQQDPVSYIHYTQIKFQADDYTQEWTNEQGHLYAELFSVGESCEKLFAIQQHLGRDGLIIYRWTGTEFQTVFDTPNYEWLGDHWNSIQNLQQDPGKPFQIQTYDFTTKNCDAGGKIAYTLRTYEWDGDAFQLIAREDVTSTICGGG
jgi:hypothetical protein